MKWRKPCLDEEDDIAHRQRLQVVKRALEALQEALQEGCSKVVKAVVCFKWYVEDNLEEWFGSYLKEMVVWITRRMGGCGRLGSTK